MPRWWHSDVFKLKVGFSPHCSPLYSDSLTKRRKISAHSTKIKGSQNRSVEVGISEHTYFLST